jgi:hypothetical protein
MIMARMPRRYGMPDPKRHVHAGSSRELTMIMGAVHLGYVVPSLKS